MCSTTALCLKVQIVSLDEEKGEFTVSATFDHPYPTTKLIWIPDSVSGKRICIIEWGACSTHHPICVIVFVFGVTSNFPVLSSARSL